MSRNLDAAVSKAVASDSFAWVILLHLALDSGDVRMHTGVGTIEWDGFDWLGVGSMGNITGMSEGVDGGDDRITVGLTGIPIESMPDFVDEFTQEDTTGRQWFMYIAVLDQDTAQVKGDASLLNSGLTGEVHLTDGQESSVVLSLVTESAINRDALFYRGTSQDQEFLFPGDKGFEFMNDLGEEIRWGSADPKKLPKGGPDISDEGRRF